MTVTEKKYRAKVVLLVCSAFLGLTGCFTGIESTPKITSKELKKQDVTEITEKRFLDGIDQQAPSLWKPGKKFYIADNRASRGAWRVEPAYVSDSLEGAIAVLSVVDTVSTLTDSVEVRLLFTIPQKNAVMEFRTGKTMNQWNNLNSFTLPHLIDMDVVDAVSSRLIGKTFYILPARRTGANSNDTIGTRYQPVRIIDVSPATESTPLRVAFVDNENHVASLLMTVGDAGASRRSFETLFALDNPRQRYKQITDDFWEKIIHGKICLGMTPDECRLALGAPDSRLSIPTTAGMVDRWNYTDGVYIIFEDGVVASFRQ